MIGLASEARTQNESPWKPSLASFSSAQRRRRTRQLSCSRDREPLNVHEAQRPAAASCLGSSIDSSRLREPRKTVRYPRLTNMLEMLSRFSYSISGRWFRLLGHRWLKFLEMIADCDCNSVGRRFLGRNARMALLAWNTLRNENWNF